MPPRWGARHSGLRPSAQEIFADRVDERGRLAGFLSALRATPFVKPPKSVLSFYGVAGIGKSALLRKVVADFEIACGTKKAKGVSVDCVICDIDREEFTPDHPSMTFYGSTLRPALHAAGFSIPLFDLLYIAWWGRTNPNLPLDLDSTVAGLMDTASKGSEVANVAAQFMGFVAAGFKAGELAFKTCKYAKDKIDQRRFAALFGEVDLETQTATELERFAPAVLAEDLISSLKKNKNKALCLAIDGFERIQWEPLAHGSRLRHDLQESIAMLFSHLAQSDQRVGMIVFGRQDLDWRQLYDDPDEENHWDLYIEGHLLGPLAEADAREFLDKVVEWCDRRPESGPLGRHVQDHAEAILAAADEEPGLSPRQFHPYSLDLAVSMIADHGERFEPEMLGKKGVKELQARFLRLMERRQRKALQALALALEFDKDLFDTLAQGRRIDYAPQDFHALTGRGATYIQQTPDGSRRFHRKMQEALLGSLTQDYGDGTAAATAEIIAAIFDHHHTAMRQALDDRDLHAAAVSYDRAAKLLICHVTESRLEIMTEFYNHYGRLECELSPSFHTAARIAIIEHELTIREKIVGPEHQAVAIDLMYLGRLHMELSDFLAARPLYERALAINENLVGPEHPDTALNLSILGTLSRELGDFAAARVR